MLVSMLENKGSQTRIVRRMLEGDAINSDEDKALPMFMDASTRGCLLAITRKAHNRNISVVAVPLKNGKNKWRILGINKLSGNLYYTEQEALVVALEEAP